MYSARYNGEHSIGFAEEAQNSDGKKENTYHTWMDFHLAPSAVPFFPPPEQKVITVDIPGINGSIDLSNSLTGKPLFKNRVGSFEFYILSDEPTEVYLRMLNTIHGKYMKIFLPDDEPERYYRGRVTVDSFTPSTDGSPSTVTISAEVEPFSYPANSSDIDQNRYL